MSYAVKRSDDGRFWRGGRWWRWTRFQRFASIHPTPEGISRFLVPSLRDQGIEPLAIACLLARLGTSRPVEAKGNLAELAADFSLDCQAEVRYDGRVTTEGEFNDLQCPPAPQRGRRPYRAFRRAMCSQAGRERRNK